MRFGSTAFLILTCSLSTANAATVTIPSGTKLYGELDEQVTSDVSKFKAGDLLKAHVWRNIVIDGQTVIEAGAPMIVQIADIRKRRIAGRGGDVKLKAVSVRSVDNTEIFLDGGYDKEAGHRTALAASLSALVLWPLIFIRGKEAVLDVGTVFDASIPADWHVAVGDRPHTLRLTSASRLTVDVLYDDFDEKTKELPLRLTLCADAGPQSAQVVSVNDKDVPALPIALTPAEPAGECKTARGTVQLKPLSEHFAKGINRFVVEAGSDKAEVILDVEM